MGGGRGGGGPESARQGPMVKTSDSGTCCHQHVFSGFIFEGMRCLLHSVYYCIKCFYASYLIPKHECKIVSS